ncbi:hypothetical protein KIF59_18875 [Enterobacter cloacae subsp. cloacae]|nr:hypothetical protein [Enterobacter cloacae subsp. cloacae]
MQRRLLTCCVRRWRTATHSGHERLVDMGSVYVEDDQLEEGQQALERCRGDLSAGWRRVR